MENKIRVLREKLGLSQGDLARAAGTNQQQIQRIETGTQSVKLDLALRICLALKSDITQVFPKTRSLLGHGKSKKSPVELLTLNNDAQVVEQFEGAGVDLDLLTWQVKFYVRGGYTSCFTISTGDKNRLREVIQWRESEDTKSFFVFHSTHVAVAVNLSHLLHYHELWDGDTDPQWHDTDIPIEHLSVVLQDSRDVLHFGVDSDPGTPDDMDAEGQLRGVLLTLDSYPHIMDELFLGFTDVDGENAFFRIPDIALLTIPLWALDERLDAGFEDSEEPDEEAVEESDENAPETNEPKRVSLNRVSRYP